jgi:archaellum component FlaF (FlaF/FlaG flagellin family)
MGFATIFATIAFAFIFASMIIFAATIQHNMSTTARVEHDRDSRAQANSNQEISIMQTDYVLNGSALYTDNLYADFVSGTAENVTIMSAGSLTLTSSSDNGTFTSQAIDTGVTTANVTEIVWTEITPLNTDIHFQLRSAATFGALTGTPFTGPDGTANTNYTTGTGEQVNLTLNRFVQYRAYLETNTPANTPELQSVQLAISRDVGVIYINVTNTGAAKLEPGATDVYIDGQRILRNQTKRISTLHDASGQALWDPGETIELTVFRTLSGAAQITISNGATTDSAIVN